MLTLILMLMLMDLLHDSVDCVKEDDHDHDDTYDDGGDDVQELAAITESKEREDTEMEQELAEVSPIHQLIRITIMIRTR